MARVIPIRVKKITHRIIKHFHPKRIILFGSQGTSHQRKDSDIDLFIEMETPLSPPERSIQISRLFGIRPWSLDVVVYTPKEVKKWQKIHGSMLSIIQKSGKVLYEA